MQFRKEFSIVQHSMLCHSVMMKFSGHQLGYRYQERERHGRQRERTDTNGDGDGDGDGDGSVK